MTKKEKDTIHTTHEPHTLPCKLNEKDKAEAAEQLARDHNQIDRDPNHIELKEAFNILGKEWGVIPYAGYERIFQ